MRKTLLLLMATALVGCATMQNQKAHVKLEFRPGSQSPEPGLTEMTAPGAETPVYISDDVALSNADIKSARVKTAPNGHQIEIVFTETGAERFAQTTEQLVGKMLGILVDGELISAPRVMEKISGGRAVIAGKFSKEEAENIASGITGR